jgi:dsRNA-specific ribonuclease
MYSEDFNDCIEETDNGIIYNPYNVNNKEITLNDIQSILTKYGVPGKVNNIQLYKRAFIHRSYCKYPTVENLKQNIKMSERPSDCMELSTKSNERLEFLGDGVLECVTKYYLYRRFSKENEGFMTEKKIALVKNEAIGKLAYEIGLHKWFVISRHAEEKKIRTNLKKLGCLFEAFVGALFLDFNKIKISDTDEWFDKVFLTGPGFQVAQIFIENIFETHIDWIELINNDDNYKNILQVKIQKEFKTTPEYVEIQHDIDGFIMGVYLCLGQPIWDVNIQNAIPFTEFKSFENIKKALEETPKMLIFLGEGKHKIKKKSEQLACEEILKYLI